MIHVVAIFLNILTRLKHTILASMQERSQVMRGRRRSRTNGGNDGSTCDTTHLDKLYVEVKYLDLLLKLADHVHHSAGATSSDNAWLPARMQKRSMNRKQLVSTSTDNVQGLFRFMGYYVNRAIHRKTEHMKLMLLTDGLAVAKDFNAQDGRQTLPGRYATHPVDNT